MSRVLLLGAAACALLSCSYRGPSGSEAAIPVSAGSERTDAAANDPIRGATMHWRWTEGPTAGTTHEHIFNDDGSMDWRILDGPSSGKSGHEMRYSTERVAASVYVVSYLAASGYTVTSVLNFDNRRIVGYASSAKDWHPVKGTFEVVK